MTNLAFWLLVCNPTATECDLAARIRHEDSAHVLAQALLAEALDGPLGPSTCILVTKRGNIEGLYGTCEEIYE